MLLLFSPFFGRHREVLNKDTDGCVESRFVIPQDGYVTKYGTFFAARSLLAAKEWALLPQHQPLKIVYGTWGLGQW